MMAGLQRSLREFLMEQGLPRVEEMSPRVLRRNSLEFLGLPVTLSPSEADSRLFDILNPAKEVIQEPFNAKSVVDRILAAPPRQSRREFYDSDEWKEVRYKALKLHGGCCQCCGVRASERIVLHVDHIKPRSKYPELELQLSNLQVLCADCNLGKRAWDETDWRPAKWSDADKSIDGVFVEVLAIMKYLIPKLTSDQHKNAFTQLFLRLCDLAERIDSSGIEHRGGSNGALPGGSITAQNRSEMHEVPIDGAG